MMLRIEKHNGGCVTTLRLIGRIRSNQIESIRSEIDGGCTTTVLDMSEVTLVDVAVVRFLIHCVDFGIELAQCPPYVSEWMIRERAEETRPDSSDTD